MAEGTKDVSQAQYRTDMKPSDTVLIVNSDTKEVQQVSVDNFGKPIEFNSVAEMRAMTSEQKSLLVSGVIKAVQLNGYYQADDTPAPILYFLSSKTVVEDGGSVFEVSGIKLIHEFGNDVDASYFGSKYGDLSDSFEPLKRCLDYVTRNEKNMIIVNKGFEYINSQRLTISGVLDNYSLTGINNPTIINTIENTHVLCTVGEVNMSLGYIINPLSTIQEGDYQLSLTSTDNLNIGDVINTKTTESIGSLTTRYLKGEFYFRIAAIDYVNKIITLDRPMSVGITNNSLLELVKPTMLHNINLKGISFISSGQNATTVKFENVEGFSMEDCSFKTSSIRCSVGFQITGLNSRIRKCYSENANDPSGSLGYGFNISGRSITVDECESSRCKHGITVASLSISSNIRYINCKVSNSIGQSSYDIHGAAYDCFINNCETYDSAGFINLRGFKGMNAIGNRFYGDISRSVLQYAVAIYGEATGRVKDVVFKGNYIENFKGIVLGSAFEGNIDNATISDNIAIGCTRFISNFSTDSGSRKTTFTNSTIDENKIIKSSAVDGVIIISGDNNRIHKNQMDINEGVGIRVVGSVSNYSLGNILTSNVFNKIGTSTRAITLAYTDRTKVSNNNGSNGYSVLINAPSETNTNLDYSVNSTSLNDGYPLSSETNTLVAPFPLNACKPVVLKNLVENNLWLRDTLKVPFFSRSITPATDFNTLIDMGIYLLGSTPVDLANALLYNIPINEGGILITYNIDVINIKQSYSTRTGKEYSRYRYNSNWTSWKRLDETFGVYPSRPILQSNETRVIVDGSSNKVIWGVGTSSGTVWRDVNGVSV